MLSKDTLKVVCVYVLCTYVSVCEAIHVCADE